MKLKRFCAIVISLAMVLSLVPTFSLTASASSVTDVIDTITGAEVVWSMPDTTGWKDADITNLDGWSASVTSGYVNLMSNDGGNYIQAYGGNPNLTVATPGYASGSDGVILEFKFKQSGWNNGTFYHKHTFYDNDGVEIGHAWIDKNQTGFIEENPIGFPADGTKVALVAINNDDGTTHTNKWYVGGELKYTQNNVAGKISGFKSFSVSGGADPWHVHMGYRSLTIASYTKPAAAVEVTATYTVNGEAVKTVKKIYDSSKADGASFDAEYYSVNGENVIYKANATTLSESTAIEMTAVENWSKYSVGNTFDKNGTPYVIKSRNLIPNGDLSHGVNGWFNGEDGAATEFSVSNNAISSNGGTGSADVQGLYRAWKIEAGKKYYFTFDSSADVAWGTVKEKNSVPRNTDGIKTLIADNGIKSGTNAIVFDATGEYLCINSGWTNAAYSNFGLYEIAVDESKVSNTTIKFVDSSDNSKEIKDAVVVKGIVGDVITISDYAPSTITYGGNPYSLDGTNPATYTVAGNNDVVTLTYTTDAFVKFTANDVTVIYGNKPIMPTKVMAETGSGNKTEVSGAVWTGYENLEAGIHTIDGTVSIDGVTVNGSVTVTVLEETFSLEDAEIPASSDKTLTFPENISGEFAMEFDYTPSDVTNNWMYISKDGALWGAGQIGLGTDGNGSGHLKAQPDTYLGYVESGKTYRVLIGGNAERGTWSVVVTSEDGSVWKADSTFRAGSDYINSIRMTPNGDKGSFSVKNIKINNPNTTLETITINATGSVSETMTVKAASAEVAPIPHYDGNIMKSRSISGDTVTLVYEETVTSTGSWYMRNNFKDDNWLTQSKYIGSHDAFADTNKVFDNEGGDLYGDTGATGSGTTVVDNSRAQSVGVLDQLNAGVRYFDVRLSRQKDGSFATVHGPAFENFRDVATSMSQWAKENPGEVIILDFQVVRDALYTSPLTSTSGDAYNGEKKGDDNAAVYEALVKLFKDTGLANYMTTNWDKKYGEITNYGEKAVILPFGKARAVNNQGGYFINRSALHNDVTYTQSGSYSDIVDYINANYGNLPDGATICTIHAYSTPTSFIGISDSLLDAAQKNNKKWIDEENFEAWMSWGKGDVLMMNDSVSNITAYYEKLNSFNRSGSFTADFEREENGVKITAPQANVPYSTKFVVEKQDGEQSVVIGDKNYTTKSAYIVKLMQFDCDSVQPTGEVTLTFPKASSDDTTVDVLIYNNEVVATAVAGEAISYKTTTLGNYVLATMAAPGVTLTVNYVDGDDTIYSETKEFAYGIEAYNVPAGDFYVVLGDKAYILNSTEAKSHVVSTDDNANDVLTVDVSVVSRYAVLRDTFANAGGSNDCNNTDNMLFIGSSGISDLNDFDADNTAVTANAGGNVGSPRIPVLEFDVPELGDGKAAKLRLYVAKANQNLNNGSMKIAANVSDVTVDEAIGYKAADVADTADIAWSDTMFTALGNAVNGRREVNTWIEIDVTEFVKSAIGDKITFTLYAPTAGAYVADREKAVAGGAYQGKAAYIDVVDAKSVTVPASATKITKNGTDVTAFAKTNDGKITLPVAATIKVTMPEPETGKENEKVVAYVDANGKVYKAGDAFAPEGEIAPLRFGLEMATGAQVRIGDGVDANGKANPGSGLRFITTVEHNDSMADLDGAEIGIIVSAEGSDNTITINADKWQDDDHTVFTAAITNLAVTNFNRKYTATPFVKVDGQTFTGTPITRSIYQVSAGLLAGDKDGTEYDEGALAAGSMLYKVLNAYVNQTGIRLQINEDKTGLEIYDVDGMSKYSGESFFTVESTSVQDGVYTITIKPVGANTTINSYWKEYIRINNNNSAIKGYTELTDNNDGTFTITFDYASLMASSNN